MVRANSEELQSELFQAIDGVRAEITEIYHTEYEPDVTRFEVTLENPVEVGGESIIVIPGLYEDNIEPANGAPTSKNENKAISNFKIFESKLDEVKWYYGLADCHGTESIIEEPEVSNDWELHDELFSLGVIPPDTTDSPERRRYNAQVNMLVKRALANMQRWPVIYRAKLRVADAMQVERLNNKGKTAEALNLLKDTLQELQLARIGGMDAKKHWDKIPNPELDPMY